MHAAPHLARGTRYAARLTNRSLHISVPMPFLFNRRAGNGADHAELGLDSSQLEGDLRDPGPDEAPALRPFAAAIPLTQQALSQILAVRRAAINEVARRLKQAGLIEYARGRVSITNRAGLEKRCCACYRLVRRHHLELLRRRR